MGERACSLDEGSELEDATEAPGGPGKYQYPEFAGWGGERYLKKLLRQILPAALFRTWEILTDYQAPGNACYLGVTRLAEIAGRSVRTMEKNLASLCAKHLLSERAERKVFRRPDGTVSCRVVVVKDFRGLYALAHEYHEWLQAPTYVVPNREMIVLIEHDPHLVAKVRRFENYRRLLSTRLPGPPAPEREEDRWFTEYQPELPFATGQRAPVKAVIECESGTIPAEVSANPGQKKVAGGSGKRIRESITRNSSRRDSIDSALSSSVLSCQDSERPGVESRQPHDPCAAGEVRKEREEGSVAALTPTASVGAPAEGPGLLAQDSVPFSTQDQGGSPARARAWPTLQDGAGEKGAGEERVLSPASLLLVDSFLAAIAGPFGDRSPKGTRTRVRALLQEAELAHPTEVVICLIRAYSVARDARTLRAPYGHPETGPANRMPLFCAMVQRLAHGRRQGHAWDVSWHQVEEEIASDACLARWWREQHRQVEGELNGSAGESSAWQEGMEQSCSPAEADQTPACVPPQRSWERRSRLSQTEEQREERAVWARKVLGRLLKMAVPLQGASVLWEHLACGNPLHHQYRGREVCALCVPDPAWPEEVMALLRSIVEEPPQAEREGEAEAWTAQPLAQESLSREELGQPREGGGWTTREEAYADAVRVLDALAENGEVGEVLLEPRGKSYRVVVRGAGGEWICEGPEQAESLMEHIRHGTLERGETLWKSYFMAQASAPLTG